MFSIELTENGDIVIDSKALSTFAESNIKRGSVRYSSAKAPFGYVNHGRRLTYPMTKRGENFIVAGVPWGIYTYGNEHVVVEMRKEVARPSSVSPLSDAAFLAESYVNAFLASKAEGDDTVLLKLNFYCISQITFCAGILQSARAMPWA